MLKILKGVAGVVLAVLVIVGIVKGLIRYSGEAGKGATLIDAVMMVIGGIADWTVFLIPKVIEFVSRIFGGA